jgi:predicted MFS family arabinose efflux permease
MVPTLGDDLALILTFTMVIWLSLGGGLTATAWQSLIAKVIPTHRHGLFFGTQSAAANLLVSLGAYCAGVFLHYLDPRVGYTACFLMAGLAMIASLGFLAKTREPESDPKEADTLDETLSDIWKRIMGILRQDKNFRWFLVVRIAYQIALMAASFYTIYIVRRFGDGRTPEAMAAALGAMTAVMALAQAVANPIVGWIGDGWSHRRIFVAGALLSAFGAFLAMIAPALGWFYLIFAIAGVANVFLWAVAITMTLEFGDETNRPYYIGLGNTLVAPATLIAVPLGGWLADAVGFEATFLVAAVSGLVTAFVLQFLMHDPKQKTATA